MKHTDIEKQAQQLEEAAAIVRGRLPWEYGYEANGKVWVDMGDSPIYLLERLNDGHEIRRKPWTLGRSINGHTLAEGQSWHRAGWTQEMLPAGYRPFILGEAGAGQIYRDGEWFNQDPRQEAFVTDKNHNHCRTTRPIPPVPPLKWAAERKAFARGEKIEYWNKSRFDKETWALIECPAWEACFEYRIYDPYRELKEAHAAGKVIQYRSNNYPQWEDQDASITWNYPNDNFKPEYRIKPTPELVELCKADISPGCAFMWPLCNWVMVSHCWETGMKLSDGQEVSFEAAMKGGGKIKNHGQADFSPCSKPKEGA